MRRFLMIAGLAVSMLALTATSVFAASGLHFVGDPSISLTSFGQLHVTGTVAGAGRTAEATLTATAEVTRGCINRGSKEPSGLVRTFTNVSASDTFATRQGRGSFDLTTEKITVGSFTCPDQMTPVLVSIRYTNILLTVTSQTGTVTWTFPNQTFWA